MAPPPDQAHGAGCRDEADDRFRQGGQPGLQWREVTDLTQEDRQEEQRPDVGEHDHELRDNGCGETGLGEQRQIQQRCGQPALTAQKHPQQHRARDQRRIGAAHTQPGVRQLGDPVDDAEDAGSGVDHRQRIERVLAQAARLRQRPGTHREDECDNRKIDQKY